MEWKLMEHWPDTGVCGILEINFKKLRREKEEERN